MMQNRTYLAAALAVCLTLGGCAGRETASVSSAGGEQVSSSPSSSQSQTQEQTPSQGQQQSQQTQEPDVSAGADAAGASSSAQDEKWAEAEEALMDIYKPMIYHFPLLIDEDNPLSAEEAYEIFQSYYICRRYHTIENYEQWIIGNVNTAHIYYVQDIAEQFVRERFGVSAEEMRSIEAYDPEVKGYHFSIYSGKDWSTLIIVDRQQEGDLYTFDFTYTMYGYQPSARCQLTLKDEAGVFSLYHYAGEAIPHS